MIKKLLAFGLIATIALVGCTKNQYRDQELSVDPYLGIRIPLYFDLLDLAKSFGILKVICQVDAVYMDDYHPGYTIELHSGNGFIGNIVANEYVYFGAGLDSGEAVECRIYTASGEQIFSEYFVPT
jgi:hypothetical protein